MAPNKNFFDDMLTKRYRFSYTDMYVGLTSVIRCYFLDLTYILYESDVPTPMEVEVG